MEEEEGGTDRQEQTGAYSLAFPCPLPVPLPHWPLLTLKSSSERKRKRGNSLLVKRACNCLPCSIVCLALCPLPLAANALASLKHACLLNPKHALQNTLPCAFLWEETFLSPLPAHSYLLSPAASLLPLTFSCSCLPYPVPFCKPCACHLPSLVDRTGTSSAWVQFSSSLRIPGSLKPFRHLLNYQKEKEKAWPSGESEDLLNRQTDRINGIIILGIWRGQTDSRGGTGLCLRGATCKT